MQQLTGNPGPPVHIVCGSAGWIYHKTMKDECCVSSSRGEPYLSSGDVPGVYTATAVYGCDELRIGQNAWGKAAENPQICHEILPRFCGS